MNFFLTETERVRGTSDSDVFCTLMLWTSATPALLSAVTTIPVPATAEKQRQVER